MKILHCSDLHANKGWFEWLVEHSADFSVVCLTGDLLDLFAIHRVEDQVRTIRDALQRIQCPLALCSGNHDSFSGPPAPEHLHQAAWLTASRRDGVWLDGDVFHFGGAAFRCVGWNGSIHTGGRQEIWLSHAPPSGSLVAAGTDESEAGDDILAKLCRAKKGPRIVLSGHQHNPRRWAEKVGRTWCFNPGVTAEASVPNHIVIDLLAETVTLRVSDQDQESVRITFERG